MGWQAVMDLLPILAQCAGLVFTLFQLHELYKRNRRRQVRRVTRPGTLRRPAGAARRMAGLR